LDDGVTGTIYYCIIGLFGAFILSAFFSAIKIIFSSTEESAAGDESESLRYHASKISDILKKRAIFSCTVVAGRTLSNAAFVVLAVYSYNLYFHIGEPITSVQRWGAPLAFSFFTLTVFAHYIPQAFALRFYRSYAIPAFYVYSPLSWFLMPFSWLFTTIHSATLSLLKYDERLAFLSDADKARITSDDTAVEGLNEEEREMIRSIFDLSETTVNEIMTPRINIAAADINSDMQSVLLLIKKDGHSRIPVYKDTIDQIVGILHIKDILPWLADHKPEEWDLSAIVKKCHYVPMGKKINDLMKDFRVKHLHLAVIVDEYGGTAGIVTMEDILEEIVGDIQDEYDEEKKVIEQTDDNTYLVDPHTELYDLSNALDIDIDLDEETDYNTLSGLIYHEYGDVPQEGTQLEYSGLRITVLKMDNQRIEKVKVETLQNSDKAAAEPF
jgi:CBS domain containing-hemolysin-like protein